MDRDAVADHAVLPGGRPVVSEVSAVAVVDGATVVIDRPSIAAMVGTVDSRACSCSQPRPSTTNSTTWSASASNAGNHARCLVGRPQQRRHDVGDAGPAVVGQYEVVHRFRFSFGATVTAAPG